MWDLWLADNIFDRSCCFVDGLFDGSGPPLGALIRTSEAVEDIQAEGGRTSEEVEASLADIQGGG
jgi:hypothetical protein